MFFGGQTVFSKNGRMYISQTKAKNERPTIQVERLEKLTVRWQEIIGKKKIPKTDLLY